MSLDIQTNKKVHFLTPAWGTWHVKRFLEFTLPSLLTEKNLPALTKECEIHFEIITSKSDHEFIEEHESIKKLSQMTSVRCTVDPRPASEIPSRLLHDTRLAALKRASQENACVIGIHADLVYASSSLPTLVRSVSTGEYSARRISAMRVIAETIEPELERMRVLDRNGTLTIDAPSLVQLSIAHMHPERAAIIPSNRVSIRSCMTNFRTAKNVYAYYEPSFDPIAIDPSTCTLNESFNVKSYTKPLHWGWDASEVFAISLAPLHYCAHYLSGVRSFSGFDDLVRIGIITNSFDSTHFPSDSKTSMCCDIVKDESIQKFESEVSLRERLQLLIFELLEVSFEIGSHFALTYSLFADELASTIQASRQIMVLKLSKKRTEQISSYIQGALEKQTLISCFIESLELLPSEPSAPKGWSFKKTRIGDWILKEEI